MRETETKVLPVLEMSCAVCAGNVESTVQALSGVEKASVNFAAGTLTVTYNPSVITLEVMQAAVQAAGYDLIAKANTIMIQFPNGTCMNTIPKSANGIDNVHAPMVFLLNIL